MTIPFAKTLAEADASDKLKCRWGRVAGLYSGVGPLSIRKFRPPNIFLARLEDESLVAGAAGGLFAIEVFEKRDGVFARDTREIFECGNID